MTPTKAEELAARLESGWCPIESPADMERAAAELRRLAAVEAERDDLKLAFAHTVRLVQDWQQSAYAMEAERDALLADAEQASKAVPALYVGLIERLMRLSTRLGIAYEGGVEHFAASLEDRLYAICRGAESLLNSVATPPAPEAQQAAGQEQDERAAFEAWAATYSTFPLERDDYPRLGTTSYTQMEQTMLWDAWQARAALAQRMERLTDGQLSALLKEARKIIRASSSRSLAKDWDRRATQALAGATTGEQR